MMDQMNHGKMHWGCCWRPMLGVALWVVGFLSFVGGVVALWQGGEFYGINYMTWYWTALVSGVLAAGKKGHGGCGGGSCCGSNTQK